MTAILATALVLIVVILWRRGLALALPRELPGPPVRHGARPSVPAGAVALAVGLLLSAVPGPALADEPLSTQSNLLVLQAVSLLANNAEVSNVVERLDDALAAPDKDGTDLAKVSQALVLVRDGPQGADGVRARGAARELLQSAIDIRAATGYGTIPQPGQVNSSEPTFAAGAETGTTVVLEELKTARGVSDWGDAVLLTLSVLAVLAGVYLSRRWRPTDTIRDLRALAAGLRRT